MNRSARIESESVHMGHLAHQTVGRGEFLRMGRVVQITLRKLEL